MAGVVSGEGTVMALQFQTKPKAFYAYALLLGEMNSVSIDSSEIRSLEYPENMMRLLCKLPVKM